MACDSPRRYRIPPFSGFTEFTPTIPKLYWNVKSQEQRILNLFDLLNKLICYADYLGIQIDVNAKDIEALHADFEKFKSGEMLDYYEQQINAWIDVNMPAIISRTVKMVYFGLNDDGHFVAYIPETWADITFDTGMVYGRTDYGRLILRFEANGSLDNTYGYSLAQTQPVAKLIADLETNAKRTDAAFDTLFTNLNQEVTLNGSV